jgi:type I restriction enzyme M protein
MLTPQLKKNIDQKWDNCWPVSSLRPLAVLDLIAYIFFIKKLDDHGLIKKKLPVASADQFIYTREIEEFTWSKLKGADAQTIHELFTKKSGLLELMKLYGTSDCLYSKYFKIPSLVPPTSKLLINVIEIINEIESSDAETKAALVEYLFRKTEVATQSGHEIISDFVSRLMVSIAEPTAQDLIWDPATGNGSLLISAANFIENSYSISLQAEKLKGIESNVVQLRLAGMRMMLHGIKDPNIDFSSTEEIKLTQKPSLVLSNLLFANIESNMAIEGEIPVPSNLKKEIFLLEQILQNLQSGARAVILVPEILLKSKSPEMIKVRQNIVDDYHLEGVINLPQISNSLFSAAGILIFNKSTETDKVWFCKMERSRKTRTVNESFAGNDKSDWLASVQLSEVNDILNKWKHRSSSSANKTDNNFYITAYDIKENHYNLNINDYKLINALAETVSEKESISIDKKPPLIATRRENLHQFFETSTPLVEKKKKRKVLPAAILLVVLLGGAFFYFYNLRGNNLVKNITEGFISQHNALDTLSKKQRTDSANVTKVNTLKTSSAAIESDSNKNKKTAISSVSQPAVAKVEETKSQADSTQSHGYTVINKTWFYRTPDTTNQKNLFLEPRPNLVVNATNEENGFVYVIYINKKGESTRGWLNKKDLEPVQ